jgi:endonuclease YncB( thermonuclease family)
MSKAWLPFSFLVALSAHSLCYPSSGQAAEVTGRVREVIDGRSFVLCNDEQGCKTVALCGISGPPDGYPGWDRSLMALHTLVGNQTVRCVPLGEGTICDGRARSRSSAGILGQCFLGEDIDIAALLVKRAFACDWVRFSGGHYSSNDPGARCDPP